MTKTRLKYYLALWPYGLLLGLVVYVLFGFLDILTIRRWDEARLAVNAYEMYFDHNYLVTHYNGLPDMWNTKPPLLIWCQVLSMKLFGINELAIRLPSAIAGLLTCVVLFYFIGRFFKDYSFGAIVVLVLITSHGYVTVHGTRTGDYDALLVLWTTLSSVFLYLAITREKLILLYPFFMTLTLGVLTKGIAILMLGPGWLIFIIWSRYFKKVIRSKYFYLGLLGFLVLSLGYYFLREMYNPGYLKAVMENELGGRFLEVYEGHNHSGWWYLDHINRFRFYSWLMWFFVSVIYLLLEENKEKRNLGYFMLTMILNFFFIISLAKTKLVWYDMPLYPFLAINVALLIHAIYNMIINERSSSYLNEKSKRLIAFMFIFCLFYYPYLDMARTINTPKEQNSDQDMAIFLRSALRGYVDVDNNIALYSEYNVHNEFYYNLLEDKGILIQSKTKEVLDKGDIVLVSEKNIKKYIDKHYVYRVLDKNRSLIQYKILDRLPTQKLMK